MLYASHTLTSSQSATITVESLRPVLCLLANHRSTEPGICDLWLSSVHYVLIRKANRFTITSLLKHNLQFITYPDIFSHLTEDPCPPLWLRHWFQLYNFSEQVVCIFERHFETLFDSIDLLYLRLFHFSSFDHINVVDTLTVSDADCWQLHRNSWQWRDYFANSFF